VTVTLSDASVLTLAVTVTAAAVGGVRMSIRPAKLAPSYAPGMYAIVTIEGEIEGVTFTAEVLAKAKGELKVAGPDTLGEALLEGS
jgi:hypothetical protein